MGAPQISDAARASLRLPAGSPYMNAATTPTAEEELQTLLDAPLFDPWSETPDECSIDTPSGCLPGLERFKHGTRGLLHGGGAVGRRLLLGHGDRGDADGQGLYSRNPPCSAPLPDVPRPACMRRPPHRGVK